MVQQNHELSPDQLIHVPQAPLEAVAGCVFKPVEKLSQYVGGQAPDVAAGPVEGVGCVWFATKLDGPRGVCFGM